MIIATLLQAPTSRQYKVQDGWLAILRPFQQCFSHIRTMGGWYAKAMSNGAPFTVKKISPRAGIALGPLDQ